MPGPHPTSRPDALSPQRRDALHAFYSHYHRLLVVTVFRAVYGITRWQIEEVCAIAWMRIAQRPDITLDRRGYHWLRTVAIREGWRITDAPELDVIDKLNHDRTAAEPLELALTTLEHDERVERLQQLTALQRRDLLLLAAGFSYREIAALTGSTYTAVNHHITQGRARLRRH